MFMIFWLLFVPTDNPLCIAFHLFIRLSNWFAAAKQNVIQFGCFEADSQGH